ncbi:transglutaminase family protein [Xenophilus arseniciresistens]|uniref:Transglutaminase family protein n=1 Tax=Xenophilus arseniciresistens TaxID=1283306 RepID=A0AAE3NDB0_9BURK|nr:transglutaminase family protein [Xenophilus arseniciresistens]MDA7418736.1 transglutaminase family protein [Xenophilus arseniciresistens]
MLIRIGYDIELQLQGPTAVVALLQVHGSRAHDLLQGSDAPQLDPPLPREHYEDSFGNRCLRVQVPAGVSRLGLHARATLHDSGQPERLPLGLAACAVEQLPPHTLGFLLPSRYCEVDSELMALAWARFGHLPRGGPQVQAVCDFVHAHLRFDYQRAHAQRSALGAWREGVGVCRDFTHLALTLCRCLNIPARYVTGYLGDIGVPAAPYPMDFSAWFEVWLDGAWHAMDARHNRPRIGRIPIAHGRDAADVPITMVFGEHQLRHFSVLTELVAP